jgi:multicomponent Na+:H+ antiporter subunit B
MNRYKDNPIVLLISRLVSPFIMLFALYIIFHGHYSPGGGFQGGTMLAASVLLIRLAMGTEISQLLFRSSWGTPLGSVGVLIYFCTGLLALILGGQFLNYVYLPFTGPSSMERSIGVLLVEVGVGLAVMGILVAIYDDLLEGEPDV